MNFFLVTVKMPGRRRANRARKKRSRRQRILNLLEGMDKKENVSGGLELESSQDTCCSEADIFLNAESPHSSDVTNTTFDNDIKQLRNISILPSLEMKRKEHLESVGVTSTNILEKRKNEFSSLKRATKRTRTSSLIPAERKDFNWPKRNSSTSCLTSWLAAAEQRLLSSSLTDETPKAKRSRDDVTVCSDDPSLLCQPVKKTKNVESLTESLRSSTQLMMEVMETSPVLTPSKKRTRHNSAMNNSVTDQKISETDDSPPIQRPKKRTKSVSKISDKMSEELLKLPESRLSLQDANLEMIPAKSVTVLESPEHRSFLAPHLQLLDSNSPTNAQSKTLQKVCFFIVLFMV
jgi:hypothetical protein